MQIRALLYNYKASRDERPISADLIERAVAIAQSTVDVVASRDGRQIKLFEDTDLQLPFLLPEDGYSCDYVRGLADEMLSFGKSLEAAGN